MPTLRDALTWLLDVLAPTRCAGCALHGNELCDACRRSLSALPRVRRCAARGAPAIIALGAHDGLLRACVLALKFDRARRVGAVLGGMLARKLDDAAGFNVIVPVPLDRHALGERGYNQAEEIARGVAAATGRPLASAALHRRHRAARQASLDSKQREANVERAFAAGAQSAAVAANSVLLVDDVVTTGATMRACATVLRSSGAARVTGAALAIKL